MVPDLDFDTAPSPSESDDEAPAMGHKQRQGFPCDARHLSGAR